MEFNKDREQFVYDDVVEWMKDLAELDVQLAVEEWSLLSDWLENVVRSRKGSSGIILSSVEQQEESRGRDLYAKRIKMYREVVEVELSTIGDYIKGDIDDYPFPTFSAMKFTVLLYKSKGDHYRHLAGLKSGQDRQEAAEISYKAYEAAAKIAESVFSSTHPIRLALALNFSSLCYEILKSPDRACGLAKQAVDEAKAKANSELDSRTRLMQTLRDYLTLWASDIPKEEKNHKDSSAKAFRGEKDEAKINL